MSIKVLTLLSTYQQQGNTKCLVDHFIKGLEETKKVEHHLHNVRTEELNGCKGCLTCAKDNEFKCSQNDKTFELMKEMLESDIVVFAFPIYWYYMPGELKKFIDRTVAFFNWNGFVPKQEVKEKLKKITFVALVTCGSAGIEASVEPIKMLAKMSGGKYEELALTGGHSNTSIAENEEKMKQGIELGKKVASQF